MVPPWELRRVGFQGRSAHGGVQRDPKEGVNAVELGLVLPALGSQLSVCSTWGWTQTSTSY